MLFSVAVGTLGIVLMTLDGPHEKVFSCLMRDSSGSKDVPWEVGYFCLFGFYMLYSLGYVNLDILALQNKR